MRCALAFVGCGPILAPAGRAGEPLGYSPVAAGFRTGDTELFVVDPDTGDARNPTRGPGSSGCDNGSRDTPRIHCKSCERRRERP